MLKKSSSNRIILSIALLAHCCVHVVLPMSESGKCPQKVHNFVRSWPEILDDTFIQNVVNRLASDEYPEDVCAPGTPKALKSNPVITHGKGDVLSAIGGDGEVLVVVDGGAVVQFPLPRKKRASSISALTFSDDSVVVGTEEGSVYALSFDDKPDTLLGNVGGVVQNLECYSPDKEKTFFTASFIDGKGISGKKICCVENAEKSGWISILNVVPQQ